MLDIDGLPVAPADVTIDAFTDEPFRYLREGEGFVLFSVGPNLVDDTKGQLIKNSDRARPDDMIWSWPRGQIRPDEKLLFAVGKDLRIPLADSRLKLCNSTHC